MLCLSFLKELLKMKGVSQQKLVVAIKLINKHMHYFMDKGRVLKSMTKSLL